MRPSIEKSENQNWRFEPTDIAELGKTCRLMGISPGFALQDAAGRGFGRVSNQIKLF